MYKRNKSVINTCSIIYNIYYYLLSKGVAVIKENNVGDEICQ